MLMFNLYHAVVLRRESFSACRFLGHNFDASVDWYSVMPCLHLCNSFVDSLLLITEGYIPLTS